MKDNLEFSSTYQKLGYAMIEQDEIAQFNTYIKVLLVPAGCKLTVDFTTYETTAPRLFFINATQLLHFTTISSPAQLLYYNRDFYCVQIHDAEVACDGLLFNNILNIPAVTLDENLIGSLFNNIKTELNHLDGSSEEMIRTYLKQIIIHATRAWKKEHLDNALELNIHADQQLFRDFGRLVELHFRTKHQVADYADLLHLAPKTLANKFSKLNLENPNDVIKTRIVLEAKRLLFYTDLTVKEIAYQLGYEDPAYFNRLFTQKAGTSPAEFRKQSKGK
jgi:AraC-like DNA-binding protein